MAGRKTALQHGRSHTPEYYVWQAMVQRCCNPNCARYKWYGARGITVCKAWRKFDAFFASVGKRPSSEHTLERIQNNIGYRPGNVEWATRKKQSNNNRRNRILKFDGKRLTLQQWSELVGINRKTIEHRLRKGYTIKDALTLPVQEKFRNKR